MGHGVHEEAAIGRRLLEDEAIAVETRHEEGVSARLEAPDQVVAGPAAGSSDEKACRHPQGPKKLGHRPPLVKPRYHHGHTFTRLIREETDMCFVDTEWSRRGYLATGVTAGIAAAANVGRSLRSEERRGGKDEHEGGELD